ncbi:DoxX family protein [Cellulomonas algicola]|uniref:DoxX family protein n=2 Tax=Cellulomonas algicola TaxID=2071633 RepID=UPI001C3F51C9|nr:DoxX family protein [Cellulomonas algicola]
MLLRRIARPLFATWFVVEGLDVVRHPAVHAAHARAALDTVDARVPAAVRGAGATRGVLGLELTERQLRSAVQAHGAALAVAGGLLAIGKAPRTAALALAALTAPLVVVNLPDKGLDRDPVVKAERRTRLVRAVSALGGALLAAADYEGRPGLSWRVQQHRAHHASDD